MKSTLLSLVLLSSLGGSAIAADELYLPTEHNHHKPTSQPRELPALFGDVGSQGMKVYQRHITLNIELRKRLKQASIPYDGTQRLTTSHPDPAELIGKGDDIVAKIFANLRTSVLGIISGVERENAALRTLLDPKKERQTKEPTQVRIDSSAIEKPQRLSGDLRSVVLQIHEKHVTRITPLKKQAIRASIPYVKTQQLPTFPLVQENPLATGEELVRLIYTNLRKSVWGIIFGEEPEIPVLETPLDQKKQPKDLPAKATVSSAIAAESRIPLRRASTDEGRMTKSPERVHGNASPTVSSLKTPVAAVSSLTKAQRRSSMPGERTTGSPKRPPMVNVMDAHSLSPSRFLLDREEERYTRFVSKLLIPKDILFTIEPLIRQALEGMTGLDFVVFDNETKLQAALNTSPRSIEALQAILQNGVQSPVVQRSDRATCATLVDTIKEQKREIEEDSLKQKIIDVTKSLLKESGIIPGWGALLPVEAQASIETQIKEIVSMFCNGEILNVSGEKIPMQSLIISLTVQSVEREDKPQDPMVLKQKFDRKLEKFKKTDITKFQKRVERGKVLDAIASVRTLPQVIWVFHPVLQRTSVGEVDIDSSKARELMKLHVPDHEEQKREFDKLANVPHATGFVVIPFKENADQLHLNLKVLSLVKPGLDLKQAQLNFNPDPIHEAKYYTAVLLPSSVDKLKELIIPHYVLWVFTPQLTGFVSEHYFVGISRDPSHSVLSLTLNQGNPRLNGQMDKFVSWARDLMAEFDS